MIVYVEDKAAMEKFTGWQGPVGRNIDRRLNKLQFLAKQTVGVSKPTPINPKPGGTLKRSITIVKDIPTPGTTAKVGIAGHVGSWYVPYARLHHTGTKPHIILPRRAKKLRFWSWKTNTVVFARLVRHPGTKPNHYLTSHLKEIV